jgi:perosamine synthetase
MTGYQAALGYSQISRIDEILANKIKVANWYKELLSTNQYLTLQGSISQTVNVYWMFGILLSTEAPISRDELMEHLSAAGVETRTFFCPMDMQPVLTEKFLMDSCPNAKTLWEYGLYLPSSATLTYEEVSYIASAINMVLDAGN